MRRPTDRYLHELRRHLRWHPVLARRAVAEAADHLAEATKVGIRSGLSPVAAEEAAIRQFGHAALIAHKYRRTGSWHAPLLLGASSATACAAIWLALVTVVGPAHDRATLVVWRSLAAGLFAYSALSSACLSGNARPALRWSVAWLSIAATALGALHVVSTLLSPGRGRFEGYVLLIAVILTGHGLIALTCALRTGANDHEWRTGR